MADTTNHRTLPTGGESASLRATTDRKTPSWSVSFSSIRRKIPLCYLLVSLYSFLILFLSKQEGRLTLAEATIDKNRTASSGTLHGLVLADPAVPLWRGPGWIPPPNISEPSLDNVLLNRLIVIPEYKLVFCYVEKVGCTMFNDIARALRILAGQLSENEYSFQLQKTWFRNTYKVHNYTKQGLEQLLADPSWTKAFFYRDPVTRFMSGYNSKCTNGENGFAHCERAFRERTLPFFEAIDKLQNDTQHVQRNPHFMPTANFCGGLRNNMDHYDFIRQLKKSTSNETVHELLRTIDVPKEHQSIVLDCFVNKRDCSKMPGFERTLGHYRGHESKHGLKERYDDDEHVRKVQEMYREDYEFLRLPLLGLDQLDSSDS